MAGDCPSLDAMVDETNTCVNKINSLADMSLAGRLNVDTRDMACKPYSQTVQCLNDILSNCTANEEQRNYQQSTLKYMRKGFGSLCESQQSFQRYTEMAVCFGKEYRNTRVCIETFTLSIETAQKEGHEAICGVYKTMSECMNRAVMPACGADAAEVLEGIIEVMRSSAVSKPCPSDNDGNGTGNSGAAMRIMSAPTWSRHVATLLLFAFLHARMPLW